MQNKLFFVSALSLFFLMQGNVNGQSKYYDKNCDVSFYSHTPIEDIEAKNTSAVSVLDVESGALEFAVLIKAFEFQKSLMQEHFNENYMESEKFPKATFKGQVTNISSVKMTTDGNYPIEITGTLIMHGVSKEISTTGTIKVSGGNIGGRSEFLVKPEDFNIAIPSVVKEKIEKELKVTVEANYSAYTN